MKTRQIMKSAVSATAIAGVLTFGAAGVAGAASSGTTPSHAVNCSKAEALGARVQKLENKASTWEAKAQARETKATSNGHPKLAKYIARRITRVERLAARGERRLTRIAGKCGSTAPASSSTSAS
jgi:hypothetical protein